ncbi:uncharacterized protein HMPREF1120_03327 [Exophiala dermatitidis NIH/UT8656]|uniref:Uncharacterized protein n=2 Tax=Exophiala dermatitidis TaxID=5970 RepID=H6BW77_EXODN|nr:uncharacterized protein HMPREF1120_03327 [Exophiala dermatitidis NIH/UT8656]EHY55177.1 hypothetical protein HMPREF1120_03327 [Exophiala dermatitidis NIH/UT8656]KAJ4665811.1 hypothetical protein HRR95_008563 [Exophiala dermatitidis]
MLPTTHGDPSLPYYELPAGNLMPHIVPNSSQPIRPEDVQALRFSGGPADESLVNALTDFLADIQTMNDKLSKLESKGSKPEMDEMGQISYRDEAGDLLGDTYYGWSRSFCERMKRRGRSDASGSPRAVSNSSSVSRSRSRGRAPYKRRRYSNSTDLSRSSRSYSRSPSRRRRRDSSVERSDSRKGSWPRSRSRSHPPDWRGARPEQPPNMPAPMSFNNMPTIPPPPTVAGLPFPPPPPLPAFQQSGVPFPPPRPINWSGQWPPPPPPPLYHPGNPAFNGLQFPPAPPNMPPPPPPPAGWPMPPTDPYGGSNGYTGRR